MVEVALGHIALWGMATDRGHTCQIHQLTSNDVTLNVVLPLTLYIPLSTKIIQYHFLCSWIINSFIFLNMLTLPYNNDALCATLIQQEIYSTIYWMSAH